MEDSLKVVIAEDSPASRRCLKDQLESLGYTILGVASTGSKAVDMTIELEPSFVIMDINMPEMDGITAAKAITKIKPIPIILITGHSSEEFVSKAVEAGVFAYLIKPISKKSLAPAVKLAFARFYEFRELKGELKDMKEALEARKLIERAKGILMKRCNMSEEDAFKLLQTHSQKENRKLKDIADMVVNADKLI